MAGLHFDATCNNEDVMRKVRESQKAFTELANTAEAQGKRIDVAFEKISLKSLERVQEIMKSFPKEVQGISSFQKQVDELEKHIERVNQRIVSVGSGKLNPTLSDTSSNINIGDVLKQQVYVGAQSINTLTEKIIQQKILIKDIENDVRTLGEAYRKAGAGTTRGNALFADFKGAKAALQEEKAALFDLQTQQAQARLSVRKLKDEQSLYQKETQKVVDSNNQMAVSFQKTLAAIGGTAMLKKFVSDVVKVRGEMQQIEVSLSTLLQNKEKADTLMSQIVKTAAETPFSVTELATGSKQLVAYGFQAEEVNDTLIRLGNIASGLGLPLERLTYLYGTTMTQGRLYARDLMQFTTSGIPMLQGLADMYGKSTDEVNKMVSAGKIGFPEVKKVIENLTDEGGKFFNLMQEQSKTLTGKISNLGDAWDEMLNKIGQSNEGILNGSLDSTKYLVEHYEAVGKVLIGLISTFGAYKAATIAYYAISKTYGVYDIATKELQFVATMKNIVATKALAVQQAILNKTALANPYVLVATLVVGAAAAMWALHDSTTAAEKAQRKFNDEQEKFNKQQEDRKRKIESLIRTIQDETETEYARVEAYEELQRYSPALVAAYSREELATLELAKSQKVLNEERDKTDYSSIISNVEKYTEYVNRLSKNGDKLRNVGNMYSGMVGEYGINTTWNDRLELAKEDLKKWQEALNTYNRLKKEAEENAKPVEVKLLEAKSSRDEIVQEFAAAKFTFEEEQRKIKESGFGIIPIDVQIRFDNAKEQLSNIDKIIASLMGKSSQTYKEAYDTAKIEWKAAQKAFEESKKKSKAEYVAAKKDLDDKEKVFKDLGGVINTSKQENAADKLRKEQEKYNQLLDKNKREQNRAEKDAQFESEQTGIDALQDGSEKTLKQRKLNHEKELEAIKREAEDNKLAAIEKARGEFDANESVKAAEKTKYVKQTFNVEEYIKSQPAQDIFKKEDERVQDKIISKEIQYNRGDDLKYILDEYQDYTDKRLAIEKKFNEDIATLQEQRKQAEKDGNTEQVEQIDRSIAQATKNKGMELMGLDYDKLKESPEYIRAFENLKETSSETLNSLLSQLENAKGAAAKVLSPDQLREYTTTIQEIMDELDARNPFQSLSDKKKELAEAEEELAKAQIELENARAQAEAVKGGAMIENGIKSSKYNPKTGKIDSTKSYLTEAQALDKVKKKTDNYNEAKDKVTKSDAKVKKSQKEVRSEIDELCNTIDDLGKSIGGPAGEIISLIGNIGSFTLMAMSGVEAAADTSANAISTVEKASVILAIISAAMQIGMKIFDLFGKDDTTEKYEKAKEAYESYINILDRVIEKQLKLAETLTGNNANAAYNKAIELIRLQNENARVLGKQYLNSGASGKSHSKGYTEVEDMSTEGWKQAADTLGISVDEFKEKMGGRMAGLFDLTDEQLAKLQENAGIFWSQLDSDTQKFADQIVDGVTQVAEVVEQKITDATLIDIDGLRSDFQDLLTDMDADSADFADNFEEYMKNAILNSMLKESYMGRLTEWRKKFYAAMDNGVTEKEYNDLKEEGQQIADEMKERRDEMADMFAWTGESSSQSSSQKGFAAMSQDTGEELNGRFTALQISNEEIKNSMLSMLVSMNLISVTVGNNSITLTEIRNLAISSNSYLEDIAGYQKRIVNEFGNKLDSINSGIKQFNSK